MGLLNRIIVSVLPIVPRFIVWRVARRYVAGAERAQALEAVRVLNAEGAAGTVALLGEHVTDPTAANQAREEYLALVQAIVDSGLDTGLSVKPSLLGLGVDEALCQRNMDAVFAAAAASDLLVRIDMEDHPSVDATLRLHRQMHERYGPDHAGLVLQAYLYRTLGDIDALPEPANVRLCKGIYVEPRRVAWQAYETVRANFVAALDKLLRQGHRVGIATHDEYLVQDAVAQLDRRAQSDRHRVGAPRAEFQTLLGVDPPLRRLLLDQGHRLRVYVPYGRQWHPYSVRRLRENPRVAGHVLRSLFRRGGGW